jgi:hypothetical protein
MMMRLGLGVMLLVIACGGKKAEDRPATDKPGSGAGDGSAGSGAGDRSGGSGASGSATGGAPPAAWKLDSRPVELSCGKKPLVIPAAAAAAAAAERALPRAAPIAGCRDQASIRALCKCLTASVDQWGKTAGLSAPAGCALETQTGAPAATVGVHSAPADPDATAAGMAYVLIAAHGKAWSAVNVVESAPDVDLTQTPRATHGASVTALEVRPRPDGTLLWIQSQNQYSETDMGEQEIHGAAALTICILPSDATREPYCHAPIKLAVWDYTFTLANADRDDACKVREAAVFSASLDSNGALSVRLERGADKTGGAGRYHM